MEYKRDEHCLHLIIYHLIWTHKHRKPVLTGPIAKDCCELIERKCAEKGWEIQELAVNPDLVHLFVRPWPTDSAAEVVKACKALTAHELREKYPAVLKKPPSLWTRSNLASIAGNISAAVIEKYIASQRGM